MHCLLELYIEYLLFTNGGILKFTQFIDSLCPLSEVTLFLFLLMLLLLPVLLVFNFVSPTHASLLTGLYNLSFKLLLEH